MTEKLWESPDAVEQLNRLGRSGFALEFLRRNMDYRRDYRRMIRAIAGRKAETLDEQVNIARRWGLQFRPRSRSPGDREAGLLAAGDFSRRRHPVGGAGGIRYLPPDPAR
jgi:hypothetical protein